MSMIPFFKLPVTASSSVGTLDPGDVRDISDFFPGLETDAWGHWLLNKDLVDSVNNRLLIAPSGVNPVFIDSHLQLTSINQSNKKALNTGLRGVPTTGFTVCTVFKQTGMTSNFAGVAGNQSNANGSASILAYPNQVSGYVSGAGFGTAPNAQVDTTKWVFSASSYSGNNANVTRNLVVESGSYSFSNTFTGTAPLTDPAIGDVYNSVCLGATIVNTTQTFGLDFGEFIVFNRALSIAELKDIAFRSKRRMLQKGIVV